MLSIEGADTPLMLEGSQKGSSDLVRGVECANTSFVWVVLVSLAPLGFFGPQQPAALVSIHAAKLLPMTKIRPMQKVKVRGQRSRSQRSQSNLTVSGL